MPEVRGLLMGIKLRAEESQKTIDTIRSQGFTLESEFEADNPVMPFDITDCDDLGVMRLFQEHNAYLQFILAQVTCAQIDESNAKKILDMAESVAMEQYAEPKMTVSAIKAKVAVDPRVEKLANAYSFAHDYRKGMEMMYTNVKMDCEFISRELTRRTSGNFSRASKFTT
jgi:hypothetical protein